MIRQSVSVRVDELTITRSAADCRATLGAGNQESTENQRVIDMAKRCVFIYKNIYFLERWCNSSQKIALYVETIVNKFLASLETLELCDDDHYVSIN